MASLTATLGARRVLAIFAHPDDEMLVVALLQRADDEGVHTSLVTVSRGERARQYPPVVRRQHLGTVRMAEVLKHGFAMGVDSQEVWAFPDRAVDSVPDRELADSMLALLERHRPDLVVTFWPASGISMHRDHMAVGAAVEAAVAESPYAPRWIAYPLLPERALRRLGGPRQDTVADNQPPPTHSVPADPGDRQRGWRIHDSQHDYVRAVYGLPPGLIFRLWDRELYAVRPVRVSANAD